MSGHCDSMIAGDNCQRGMAMKNYDAIIIGSGCGAIISDEAAAHGLKTALIDKGPLIGGTCLNWGCIPTKTLKYSAEAIANAQRLKQFGIDFEGELAPDIHAIMTRKDRVVTTLVSGIQKAFSAGKIR